MKQHHPGIFVLIDHENIYLTQFMALVINLKYNFILFKLVCMVTKQVT